MSFKITGTAQVVKVASNLSDLEGFKLVASKSGVDLGAIAQQWGLSLEAASDKVLFFRAKMLGYDLPNGNGDAIPRVYASTFGPSFIGKHLDVNHETDPEHIIGKVLATFHVEVPINASEGEERIIGKNMIADLAEGDTTHELQLEGICMIDRTTALGDDIAKKLISGVLDSVSQEASTEYAECSVCAHRINNPLEPLCQHLDSSSLMIKSYQIEGKKYKVLAFKRHHGPNIIGTGLGVVVTPAYGKAKVSDLAASQTLETNLTASETAAPTTIEETSVEAKEVPPHIEILSLSKEYSDVYSALTQVSNVASKSNLSVSAGIVSGDTSTIMDVAESAAGVGLGYRSLVDNFWNCAGDIDQGISAILDAKQEGKEEKEVRALFAGLSEEAKRLSLDSLVPLTSLLKASDAEFNGALGRALHLRSFLMDRTELKADEKYVSALQAVHIAAGKDDITATKEALTKLMEVEAELTGIPAEEYADTPVTALLVKTGFVVGSSMFDENPDLATAGRLLAYLLPETSVQADLSKEELDERVRQSRKIVDDAHAAEQGRKNLVETLESLKTTMSKEEFAELLQQVAAGDLSKLLPPQEEQKEKRLFPSPEGFKLTVEPGVRIVTKNKLASEASLVQPKHGTDTTILSYLVPDNGTFYTLQIDAAGRKKRPTRLSQEVGKTIITDYLAKIGRMGGESKSLKKRAAAVRNLRMGRSKLAQMKNAGLDETDALTISSAPLEEMSNTQLQRLGDVWREAAENAPASVDTTPITEHVETIEQHMGAEASQVEAKAPYTAVPGKKGTPFKLGDKFFRRERLYWSPKSGSSKTSPEAEVKDLTQPGAKKTEIDGPKKVMASETVEAAPAYDVQQLLDTVQMTLPFIGAGMAGFLTDLVMTNRKESQASRDLLTTQIANLKNLSKADKDILHNELLRIVGDGRVTPQVATEAIGEVLTNKDLSEQAKTVLRNLMIVEEQTGEVAYPAEKNIEKLQDPQTLKFKGSEDLDTIKLNVLLGSSSDEERFDNIYNLRSFVENENPDLLAHGDYIDAITVEALKAFSKEQIVALYKSRGYAELQDAAKNPVVDAFVTGLASGEK